MQKCSLAEKNVLDAGTGSFYLNEWCRIFWCLGNVVSPSRLCRCRHPVLLAFHVQSELISAKVAITCICTRLLLSDLKEMWQLQKRLRSPIVCFCNCSSNRVLLLGFQLTLRDCRRISSHAVITRGTNPLESPNFDCYFVLWSFIFSLHFLHAIRSVTNLLHTVVLTTTILFGLDNFLRFGKSQLLFFVCVWL